MSGGFRLGVFAGVAVLAACQRDPGPWTSAHVLAPALARVDANADGKVTQDEYDAVSLGAPSFAEADTNHDGALSLTELRALTLAQDPIAYAEAAKTAGQGAYPVGPGDFVGGATMEQPATGGPPNETWFVLQVLREEIRSVNPGAQLPDDTMLSIAGRTNSLASPDSQWVLSQLAQQAAAAGLDFPSGLLAQTVPGDAAPTGTAAPAAATVPAPAAPLPE